MLLEHDVKETYKSKINLSFDWFDKNFTNLIQESFKNFWECDYTLKLLAVTDNDFSFFKNEEFFVTKIGIKKHLNISIRTSKSSIDMLFDCLGKYNDFDITKITELEAKILNSFNEFIYEEFKNKLISSDKKYYDEPQVVNLVYTVKNTKNEVGRYIISIPIDILKIEPPQDEREFLNIKNFYTSPAKIDIRVGTTKMTLNDIKNLTIEDIVILDDSNLNRMKIRIGEQRKYFKVAPEPTLIMNLEDNGDSEIMDNSTLSKDMWDNIQVEIGAEFEKVKISLGDLKQISEGLVVDISSIYENKIFLKVENKAIAQGELVIINDRYGVRIDKLMNDEDEVQYNQNTQYEQPIQQDETVEEEPLNQEEVSEDDFDYSDFEIEDENI